MPGKKGQPGGTSDANLSRKYSRTDGLYGAHDSARTPTAITVTPEEELNEWRLAEQAAVDAETTIARMGQGAPDPRVAELMARARQLRDTADALLAHILQTGARPPPSGHDGH